MGFERRLRFEELEVRVVLSVSLPGNFDADNAVGASDYVLWRKTLGQTVTQNAGADASGNGVVDQSDYDAWRKDFGATSSTNWFDANIVDAALRSCGSNLYVDGVIDRIDALALFRQVEADGTVDATE